MQDKDLTNEIKNKMFDEKKSMFGSQSVWERMTNSVTEADVDRLKDNKANVFVENKEESIEEKRAFTNKEIRQMARRQVDEIVDEIAITEEGLSILSMRALNHIKRAVIMDLEIYKAAYKEVVNDHPGVLKEKTTYELESDYYTKADQDFEKWVAELEKFKVQREVSLAVMVEAGNHVEIDSAVKYIDNLYAKEEAEAQQELDRCKEQRAALAEVKGQLYEEEDRITGFVVNKED